MTDIQLNFLLDFKNKKKHAPSKQDHDEVDDIISDLKSYNIISRMRNSKTLEIVDGISFDKLIELKSFSEFKKWYSDKDKIIVDNSLNNYGDNYGYQSLEKIVVKKNKIKQTINSTKKPSILEVIKSFLSKFWWTIIIPLVIGILLILIERGALDIGI